MPAEATIQRAIIKALRERGIYVFHALNAEAGTPDLIACVDGRFIALEVKAPKGRVSAIQRHRMEQIQAAGGIAVVVRSVEDALATL